jgi:protocatechuate 3,4-dioxygenase beta subunit
MSLNTKILVPTPPDNLLRSSALAKLNRREMIKMAFSIATLSFASKGFANDEPGFDLKSTVMPTPDQILGPFYPVEKPLDGKNDLTKLKGRAGKAAGEVIYVTGQILNVQGKPCPGVKLEIWQANSNGKYKHPSDRTDSPIDPNFDGYATILSDAKGRFYFKTIKPGAYPVAGNYVRPPHIHFDITGKINRLITQMYFPNEPLNDVDPLLQQSWAKDSLIAKVMPPDTNQEPNSKLVVWDIVLIKG